MSRIPWYISLIISIHIGCVPKVNLPVANLVNSQNWDGTGHLAITPDPGMYSADTRLLAIKPALNDQLTEVCVTAGFEVWRWQNSAWHCSASAIGAERHTAGSWQVIEDLLCESDLPYGQMTITHQCIPAPPEPITPKQGPTRYALDPANGRTYVVPPGCPDPLPAGE